MRVNVSELGPGLLKLHVPSARPGIRNKRTPPLRKSPRRGRPRLIYHYARSYPSRPLKHQFANVSIWLALSSPCRVETKGRIGVGGRLSSSSLQNRKAALDIHSPTSAMAAAGIDLYTAVTIAGHRNPATTRRYAHLGSPELRAAARGGVQTSSRLGLILLLPPFSSSF